MDKLHHAIYHILELAILHGGTRVEDFANQKGAPEAMQKFLQIYGRAGESCHRCKKSSVEKIKVLGKVAYICQYCQPLRNGKKTDSETE
jgi:formamidopyrimidine-DNA glycosylase